MRAIWIALCATACAGQQAAHLFPPGGGDCADPAGCAAPVDGAGRFEPPDADHPVPPVTGTLDNSCAAVGLAVSALTDGNYATPEERAPHVAATKATCARLALDADKRACIVTADDQATMQYCAPEMFGGSVEIVAADECDGIARDMRSHMRDVPMARADEPIWRRRFAALAESCRRDRWTLPFAECARTTVAPESCYQFAPAPLQKKVAERYQRASTP